MTVSLQEIRRIAALARLRFEQGEAERMAHDMSTILDHMAVLVGADLKPVRTSGLPGREGAARSGGDDAGGEDLAGAHRTAEPDPLVRSPSRLAPDWREGFFVVPRLPGVTGAPGEPEDAP